MALIKIFILNRAHHHFICTITFNGLCLVVHVYSQTTAELTDLRKSLKLANNQIEETRRKYLQSQEEQKKMKAILAKEIGDGTLINACVCFLFMLGSS